MLESVLSNLNGKQIQTNRRPCYTPKPDADLCMWVELPLDKKLENHYWAVGRRGPSRAVGRGQPGLRAAGPLGRGGPPGFSDGITFTKLTHRFEYVSSNSLQDGHRLNRYGVERDTFL